jgi:small ligand-binding sensory domain FIST
MKWSGSLSQASSLRDAVIECADAIRQDMDGLDPDLVVVFVSPHHEASYDDLPLLVRQEFGTGMLLGCSGTGIIGDGREIEDRPAVSITAAHLPDVNLLPFHLDAGDLPDADAAPDSWEIPLNTRRDREPDFLLLSDPFSMPMDRLLAGLDYAFPDGVKAGGLASGGAQPGSNALFLREGVHRSGVVGLSLQGAISVDTIVAQGCRPIGLPIRVTACSANVILGLDDRGPLEVLSEVLQGLSEKDRNMSRHSLFMGIAMDPFNEDPLPGDFLIRDLIGVDQTHNVLAVSESVAEGQIVQFHLRDAETSAGDLESMLTRYTITNPIGEDTGALLFQCLGRGAGLYGTANHDTGMFNSKIRGIPMTGFFCNGEIGPVGGSTFLHRYTSAFAIFRPK